MRIHSGTEEIWRSSTVVGGGGPKIEVIRQIERGGRSFFYQMEPTPLAVDLDGDGVQEIIVPQNKDDNGVIAVIFRTTSGCRFRPISTESGRMWWTGSSGTAPTGSRSSSTGSTTCGAPFL